MTPQIRMAQAADAEQIAAVGVAAWRVGYADLLPEAFLSGLSVESRTAFWRTALTTPGDVRTLVAVLDDRVVAFASVGPSRDDDAPTDTGELWALNVHPDVWGSGIGSAMHDRALQELAEMGFPAATLWVLTGNERARRLYERHGWQPDGHTQTGWSGEVRFDETRYHLPALTGSRRATSPRS